MAWPPLLWGILALAGHLALDALRVPPRPVVAVTLPPGAGEAARQAAIDDALLVAAARAAGWHRSDPVVQRRLLELAGSSADAADAADALDQAYALGLDALDPLAVARLRDRARRALGEVEAPSDAELQDVLAAHASRFRRPAALEVEHRVWTAERHEDPEAAARRELASGTPRGDAVAGLRSRARTSVEALEAAWGAPVADLARSAPVGAWVGPVRAAHGAHALRVLQREDAVLPPLEAIREEVLAAWREEASARRVRDRLDALRATVDLRVEDP
ncbi:MAG: peptidyl-prolyl cis-trans isomerase [Alphaproteobacteria bacterium]|nr:peptidyl-prolyl cis-trans isomerase [Alphaproteobacteria bacterium]